MKRNFICGRVYSALMLLILAIGPIQAKTLLESIDLNPYLGIEYQYQHMKVSKVWRKFMPANLNYSAIFLGNKYHQNFGIEFGYHHSIKKSQGSALLTDFGGIAATGNTVVFGQMRNKGFSFDWNVYYPLDKNFNIMAILGFMTNHPYIEIVSSSATDLATSLVSVKAKNKTVFRPGIGAEYYAKNWGVRGRILWANTQKLCVNVDRVATKFRTITQNAFKQSVFVTFGVFYIF